MEKFALFIFILALLLIAVRIAIDYFFKEEEEEQSPFYLRQSAMNSSEQALFINLNKQLSSQYIILSKVRIEDFVGVKREGLSDNERFGFRNRIKSRHVDFLICDSKTTRPLMVVELDGSSHNKYGRRKRDYRLDEIYKNINLQYEHIRVGSSFEEQAGRIKERLMNKNS